MCPYGMALQESGVTPTLSQNIASVKFHNIHGFLSNCIFTGVNCTKEDLEALTNTNNEVELLEFDENELWYEKSYK